MTWFDDFKEGFRDRFGEGREDYRLAYYQGRSREGKDPEGTRIGSTLGTNPTFTTVRDLVSETKLPDWMGSRQDHREARQDAGMGLAEPGPRRTGQILGTMANDLTQDHTRSLWWLLNAPQATGNVVAELALAKANPDLFKHDTPTFSDFGTVQRNNATGESVRTKGGIPKVLISRDGELQTEGLTKKQQARNEMAYRKALETEMIDKAGNRRKGVRVNEFGEYTKRKYNPGDVASLMIPTGIAINAGIGLLNPLGGSGGYEAVLPSQDDPTKTGNVIGEVAAKYILGRTGNLLPYEEFSKYRPDVDIGEYNRYKAFKYDKEMDYDISDGDVNLLPAGVLKATVDGIHGPELQFLGRSLPVTTTLVPYLGALAGGYLGVTNESPDAQGVKRKRPIKRGLLGGMAGLGAGAATGLIAEEMRRRAGSNNVQLEGGNAEQYLR